MKYPQYKEEYLEREQISKREKWGQTLNCEL